MQLDKNHVPSTTSIQSDNVHQSQHSYDKNSETEMKMDLKINAEQKQ